MIQMIVIYTCGRCESLNIVRNGHDYKGGHKYRCKDGERYGTLNAKRGYDAVTQAQVQRGLLERVSLCGLERLLRRSRRTIRRWLVTWIDELPPVSASLLPTETAHVLELDELWSFVGNKRQESWLWLALCRLTRQVVA